MLAVRGRVGVVGIRYVIGAALLPMSFQLTVVLVLLAATLPCSHAAGSKVPIIIDTDMSIDVDDVGMLCAAHALQDNGETEILGMVHDSGAKAGAGAISVINRYYGRDEIPIGAYRGKIGARSGCAPKVKDQPEPPCEGWEDNPHEHWTNDGQGVYIDDLVRLFPHRIASADEAPDAVTVYRDALSAAAEHSVVIVSVGFTTNLLDLIRSRPDSSSPLTGKDLVKSRVKKLVLMGGRREPGWNDPPEWNLAGCGGGCGHFDDLADLSENTFNEWPDSVPIEMIGFEIGVDVHTGYVNQTGLHPSPKYMNSPCRVAYRLFCARMHGWCEKDKGRASWDPMALVYAVRGEQGFYSKQFGMLQVDPVTGMNRWLKRDSTDFNDYYECDGDCEDMVYLLPLVRAEVLERSINELIEQEPANGGYEPPSPSPSPPPPPPPPRRFPPPPALSFASDSFSWAHSPPSPYTPMAPSYPDPRPLGALSAALRSRMSSLRSGISGGTGGGYSRSGQLWWSPSSFHSALALAILSLVCWGSWSTTSKAARHVKFPLFYLDFSLGAWLAALLAFGMFGGLSMFRDSPQSGGSRIFAALLAGCIFNLANVLLIAGVSLSGLAVAFPVGIGLALVLGTLLTHMIDAQSHRTDLLFLGVFAAFFAILLQVAAYRHHAATRPSVAVRAGGREQISEYDDVEILSPASLRSSGQRSKEGDCSGGECRTSSESPTRTSVIETAERMEGLSDPQIPGIGSDVLSPAAVRSARRARKGLCVCLASGVLMALWSPLSALSMALGPDRVHCHGCLTPYASSLVFCSAVMLTSPLICKVLMVWPLVGASSSFSEYRMLYARDHAWGVLGGCLWAIGTIANLISGSAIGLTLSYAIGQAAPMIAVAWGVFYYREFVGADWITTGLITGMTMWYSAAILLTASSRKL